MSRRKYNDNHIVKLKQLVESLREDWPKITLAFNKFFGLTKTTKSLQGLFFEYQNVEMTEETLVANVEKARRAATENSKLRKTQTILVDKQISYKDLMDEITSSVKKLVFIPVKTKVPKKDKTKKSLIVEPVLSDLHYGLKTKTYGVDKTTACIKYFSQALIKEIHRYENIFNVERINLLFLGDLIQSATMHKDSGQSCEATNPQQVYGIIELLFQELFVPLIQLGYPIDVVALCGNHDRTESEQHIVKPGATYFTYTIYKCLELLVKQVKPTQKINFFIPEDEAFYIYDIFGHNFLAEHGNEICKRGTNTDLEALISKRGVQTNKLIKGVRIGHFHEDSVSCIGRYIKNGTTTSNDYFAKSKGYKTNPCQLINYYVETKHRNTPYYHTFVVNMENL